MDYSLNRHYTIKRMQSDWVAYRAIGIIRQPKMMACTLDRDYDGDGEWTIFVKYPEARRYMYENSMPDSIKHVPMRCLYADPYCQHFIPVEKRPFIFGLSVDGGELHCSSDVYNPNDPDVIIDTICGYFRVGRKGVMSDSRLARFVNARKHIYWWLFTVIHMPISVIDNILSKNRVYGIENQMQELSLSKGLDRFVDSMNTMLYRDTCGVPVMHNHNRKLSSDTDRVIDTICSYFFIDRTVCFKYVSKYNSVVNSYIAWYMIDIMGLNKAVTSSNFRYIDTDGDVVKKNDGCSFWYYKNLKPLRGTDEFNRITTDLLDLLKGDANV